MAASLARRPQNPGTGSGPLFARLPARAGAGREHMVRQDPPLDMGLPGW